MARILDARSGESLGTVAVGVGPHEVAVAPNGRLAVVSNYGGKEAGSTLSVFALGRAGQQEARVIDLGEAVRPHGLAFAANSRLLWVTCEALEGLWQVDLETGTVNAKVNVGAGTGHMLAVLDPDHLFVTHIAAGCVTPVVHQADGSFKALPRIATGAGAEGIAVQPHSNWVWVTNRSADTVSIIDASALKEAFELPCEGFPIRVEFPSDGKLAAVSCSRVGVVAIFDTSTRKEVTRIPIHLVAKDDADSRLFGDSFGKSPVPIGMAFGADGYHLYVSCSGADRIAAVDLRLERPVAAFETGKEPDGIAWFPVATEQNRLGGRSRVR